MDLDLDLDLDRDPDLSLSIQIQIARAIRAQPRQCYENCVRALIAIERSANQIHPIQIRYVEGFLLADHDRDHDHDHDPIAHAWLTLGGRTLEITPPWSDRERRDLTSASYVAIASYTLHPRSLPRAFPLSPELIDHCDRARCDQYERRIHA